MSDKIIVTLRSAPSVSVEILDKKCQRSCFGALRFYPGIPKVITKAELEHLTKIKGDIASKLDIRPYVESKRIDRRGASETEIENLAKTEGIDHLHFKKKVELLQKRGKQLLLVARLLDAWETVVAGMRSGPSLVVAGDCSGRSGRKLRVRVRRSASLKERVTFAGRVSEEEKAALLAGAEVFVQPSLYEGFGMTLLEAMAAATPVACSSLPAHWEAAGTAAIYFDPRDPADMAAALVRIARNRQLRADLKAAGERQAARFTWRRSASLLEEAYRSVGSA